MPTIGEPPKKKRKAPPPWQTTGLPAPSAAPPMAPPPFVPASAAPFSAGDARLHLAAYHACAQRFREYQWTMSAYLWHWHQYLYANGAELPPAAPGGMAGGVGIVGGPPPVPLEGSPPTNIRAVSSRGRTAAALPSPRQHPNPPGKLAARGNWTPAEDELVRTTVMAHEGDGPFAQWAYLARKLPGRTGKSTRDRYMNHLDPNLDHSPFSPEDDLLLWESYGKYGTRWCEISSGAFHGKRSENMVKNRWNGRAFKDFVAEKFGKEAYAAAVKEYSDARKEASQDGQLVNEPAPRKKSQKSQVSQTGTGPAARQNSHAWSKEEDELVVRRVTEETARSHAPFTKWAELAKELPGRGRKDVRDRWVKHLSPAMENPALAHDPVAREDDAKLWEAYETYRGRWADISEKAFDAARSETMLKNRWHSAAFRSYVSEAHGRDAYREAMERAKEPSEEGQIIL